MSDLFLFYKFYQCFKKVGLTNHTLHLQLNVSSVQLVSFHFIGLSCLKHFYLSLFDFDSLLTFSMWRRGDLHMKQDSGRGT